MHNAIPAWQVGATGRGVTIGIVDTGIDRSNPEFVGRISAASADVTGGGRDFQQEDDHGTMVALQAAAARDNIGILGVAYNATVLVLRADAPGTCASETASDPESGCRFSDTAIAAGVNRAVDSGAKVINLSLGGSPPDPVLSNAIRRAASAGVVVIVAAGNDADEPPPGTDPAQPDPFASGIRRVGNGNVIVAGSVTEAGVLSEFSNLAGNDASWYLSAMGDRVCCVYENGVLRTTTNASGQTFVYVSSGTSFAAPQIAGAAALLIQAFPNLTAVQVVDLLLRTGRDAGPAGIDVQYGRGILDIAAAFAPQGQTTLAGTAAQAALSATSVMTSPAMGDAAQGTALSSVMLDSYGRAYHIDLAQRLESATVNPRLAGALTSRTRHVSAGGDALALAFSIDGKGAAAQLPWSGQLRLSSGDARAARVLAGRVIARLSPTTRVAFGFAEGSDGLRSQLQGTSRPAFLVAGDPNSDTGFVRKDEMALALRRQLGPWGLTLAAERGSVGQSRDNRLAFEAGRGREARYTRLGLGLDRRWRDLDAALAATWLGEERSVLGAQLSGAFGSPGADSVTLDGSAGWSLSPLWRIGGSWRHMRTRAHTGGVIASGSGLTADGWSIDLARSAVFQSGDSIALRFSQPLRVSSGGINTVLPTEYDYASLTARMEQRQINLSPQGRELTSELAWRGALWGGAASASLFYRKDPGHYAALPDDKGLAMSWRAEF